MQANLTSLARKRRSKFDKFDCPEAIKFKINLQDKSATDNQLASVKYRELSASHAKRALL